MLVSIIGWPRLAIYFRLSLQVGRAASCMCNTPSPRVHHCPAPHLDADKCKFETSATFG